MISSLERGLVKCFSPAPTRTSRDLCAQVKASNLDFCRTGARENSCVALGKEASASGCWLITQPKSFPSQSFSFHFFSFFFLYLLAKYFSYNIYIYHIYRLSPNLSQILPTFLPIRLHCLPTHSPSKKKQKGIKTIKKTKLLKENKKHTNMESVLCWPSYP